MLKMFKTYWRARKLFKPPKLVFYHYNSTRWFDFSCTDVLWKLKYDWVCVEGCPELNLTIFKHSFRFILTWPSSDYEDYDCYWESILTFLYKCDKSLEHTIIECGTLTRYPDKKKHFVLSKNYLKDKYRNLYDSVICNYLAKDYES